MSLSDKIRQQVLSSFRAELAEHIQTMTDGLLAIEQSSLSGEARQLTLDNIFRAAHKGAPDAQIARLILVDLDDQDLDGDHHRSEVGQLADVRIDLDNDFLFFLGTDGVHVQRDHAEQGKESHRGES